MAITHALSATTPNDPNYEIGVNAWNSAHVQAMTILGNTAGASTISGTNIVFSAGPNATLSVNGSTLVFSGGAGAAGNTGYLSDSANTASLGTIVLSNSNGFAWGLNGQTLTASYTQAAQTNQSEGFYAVGNTTQNSSTTLDARTVSFGGRGIITVGYSNGTVQISATEVPQTNQTVGLYGLGNTTQNSSTTLDARTLSFNGLGGMTVGYSNGSIQLSGAQTVAQTNQTMGLYASSNTTAQSSSTTIDARSLTVRGVGAISVGYSAGELVLSAAAGGQTNQTLGFYATSNTTGASSSSTYDARSVTMRAYGILSIGHSNGSVQFSTPDAVDITQLSVGNSNLGNTAGDTGVFTGRVVFVGSNNITLSGSSNAGSQTISIIGGAGGGGVALYDGANSITSGTARFTNANGVSFTFNGQTISGSVAAQTNQTLGIYNSSQTTGASSSFTHDARSLSIVYSGNISGGWTNSSLLLNVTTAVQTNQTVGMYATGNTTQNSSTTFDARTLGSLNGLGAMTVGYSNGSIQLSAPATSSLVGTSGVSISTNGSTISAMLAPVISRWDNYYGESLAALQYGNGTVQFMPFPLQAYGSFSRADLMLSASLSSSSNSSHGGTLSVALGIFTRNVSTLSLASSGSVSYAWTNTSSNSQDNLSGQKQFSIPINVNATPGDYWIGLWSRTTTANANWITISNVVMSNHSSAHSGKFLSVTNASNQVQYGLAQFSASSSTLNNSYALTDLRGTASNLKLPAAVQFINYTA